jgi:tryptophanyl-tRNA synthetase
MSTTTYTLPARATERPSPVAGDPTAHRVLSGDRPTGALHLGHYLGTLANRVRLQQAGLPVVLVIADYQVITDRDSTGSGGTGESLRDRIRALVADYLACGIDPDRTVIFPHSAVPALNQLLLPFLSLVTDAELRRNPTVKAELQESKRPLSGLLLTYPVHQAADILFCDADLVPVGKDQLPHLEVSRVIARRFNERYGPTFTEPQALLSPAPLVLGTDGRKMSKSAGNTIPLGATEDATAQAFRGARTDAERVITYEPDRRPEIASLLTIAALCRGERPEDVADTIGDGGAAKLKLLVTDAVNDHLRTIRARRRELMADTGFLDAVLLDGTAAATAMAVDTLARVRVAMGMDYSSG